MINATRVVSSAAAGLVNAPVTTRSSWARDAVDAMPSPVRASTRALAVVMIARQMSVAKFAATSPMTRRGARSAAP